MNAKKSKKSHSSAQEELSQAQEKPTQAQEELPQAQEKPTQAQEEPPQLEASYTHPTEVLLGLLFEAWIGHLLSPCIHWMTRTWGHHRAQESYDTARIFDQLDLLGGGDHAALLESFEVFRDTCFDELAARLADRDKKD